MNTDVTNYNTLISDNFTRFFHYLKSHDYPVNPGNVLDAMRAIESLGLNNPTTLKNGLKACLCQTKTQWNKFDALFYLYWFSHNNEDNRNVEEPQTQIAQTTNRLVGLAGTTNDSAINNAMLGAGDYTALSLADFRFMFNPEEKKHIEFLVQELAAKCRRQQSRRYFVSPNGKRLSLSKTIRKSMRYEGTAFELIRLRKRKKLPGFVLLLDISQSMDIYARLFLRFTRQLLSQFEQSHAFAFNIELIDLGKGFYNLTESDVEQTINTASSGWVGGTRIASSLSTFESQFASKVLKPNTKVVVFSDGFDTDKPAKLELITRKIAGQCREIIWVNPLLGRLPSNHTDKRMDAIKPWLSHYISAHNLESLRNFQQVLIR